MIQPGHPFRLIVFDIDGTLVDSQHAILEVMATAFAGEGLACPTLEVVRRHVGLGIEETMVRLLPEADALLHRRLAQGFREAAFALRRRPGFTEPLYPGISEALEGLRHPAVFLGNALIRRVPLHIVRTIAALLFLGIGLWLLAQTARLI